MTKFIVPFLCALITPTLLFVLPFFVVTIADPHPPEGAVYLVMIVVSMAVTAIHLIFLGLPVVWLLRKFRSFNWWSLSFSGFLLGCIPMAIDSLPSSPKGAYDLQNKLAFAINGVPISEFWIRYVEHVFTMGAFGAVTGIVFWYSWKCANQSIT